MWTKNIRLDGWDYRNAAWYFVTLVCNDRDSFFGSIQNGIICLNEIGTAARQFFIKIPNHYPNVVLDTSIVMPNHIHGIIGLTSLHEIKSKLDQASRVVDHHDDRLHGNPEFMRPPESEKFVRKPGSQSGSLSVIISQYKSAVTRFCNQSGYGGFKWQPNFYDHIIRNEKSLQNIRHYIQHNPANWTEDRFYA